MSSNIIMAVIIDNRCNSAPEVQEILTENGCLIKARIGLHQTNDCSENGLILLYLNGNNKDIINLEKQLTAVNRVKVNKMEINL